MNIAYSCDDYYVEQTGISIISVCENNKEVDNIRFFLISKNISKDNINCLEKICNQYGRELKVINFSDIAYDLDITAIGRHIATIYAKVYFPRIEGIDKLIYFDSDTVITGSLKDLWDINLDGCYLGAVETFAKKSIREKLGLPVDAPFFNDGMVIENVAYCRENDLIGQMNQVIKKYNGAPPTLSEGALNKICYGKVKYISPRWNMMAGLLFFGLKDINYLANRLHYSKEELSKSIESPTVIHYLTAFYNRPWFKKCSHPYKGEYYKYKELSPWKNTVLREGDLPFRIKSIKTLINILGPVKFDMLRDKLGINK